MRELERAAVDHLGQVRGAEPLLQLLQRVLAEDPGVPGPHFPAPDDHAVAACGFTSGETRAGGERASRRRAVAAARNPSGALKFLAIWERSPGRTLPPACLIARMSRPLSSRPEGGAGGPRPGKWDILGPPNPSAFGVRRVPESANRFSPTAAAAVIRRAVCRPRGSKKKAAPQRTRRTLRVAPAARKLRADPNFLLVRLVRTTELKRQVSPPPTARVPDRPSNSRGDARSCGPGRLWF